MQKSLGDRMKEYEGVSRHRLIRRMPVVIRLDGKAFHTYTKNCNKPFDIGLHRARTETLNYLCNTTQGCIVGYSQSDELSLVLKDWQTLNTCAWFDNNLQKIVSVSASTCTMKWNRVVNLFSTKLTSDAVFDSRAFNVPREDLINYLVWRQQDWERNSVQMLAQSLYPHKELQNLSCRDLIVKIEEEHSTVWGNLEPWKKQGEVWIKGRGIVNDFIFSKRRSEITEILDKEESK